MTVEPDTDVRTEQTNRQRSLIVAAAWAGVAGPVLFTASFLVQEAFRRDEYSPMAEQVSALEAGPNGWIQQVTFVVLGALTMLHAIGLHRGIRAVRRRDALGPALLFVTGIASVVAGVFPLREDAAGTTYDPGGHIVGGMLFFLLTPAAFLVLSRRMSRDRHWRSLTPYVRAAGLLAVASAVVMVRFVIPDDAPLHEWAGLAQRLVVLGLFFPCRIAISLRLLTAAKRFS